VLDVGSSSTRSLDSCWFPPGRVPLSGPVHLWDARRPLMAGEALLICRGREYGGKSSTFVPHDLT